MTGWVILPRGDIPIFYCPESTKTSRPVILGYFTLNVYLSHLEHLSYDNFNEGTRLKQSVAFHQKYVGKCSQLAADAIYATNENRRYCNNLDIATSFIPKGKQGKLVEQKSAMQYALSAARATVLEGSFGNEKNHYLLQKVKARTEATKLPGYFLGCLPPMHQLSANGSLATN